MLRHLGCVVGMAVALTAGSAAAVAGGGVSSAVTEALAVAAGVGGQALPFDGSSIPPGFPTERSTGVPVGTLLRSWTGDLTVTKPGSVVDRLDIQGCVTVRASDVTIRRSRIRCGAGKPGYWPVRVYPGFSRTLVEDVEIDGLREASVAVLGTGYTLRRLNIHDVVDGPRLGSDTLIEDSYVHHLAHLPKTHNDALQTIGGTNITVRHNTLLAYNPDRDDPNNGVIQTGRLHSRLENMVVEGNYMNGGSYTVRGGSGPRDRDKIASYVFRNNVFGHDCGYGPVNGVDAPVTWEPNNYWVDNASRPISTDSKANKAGCSKRARSNATGKSN